MKVGFNTISRQNEIVKQLKRDLNCGEYQPNTNGTAVNEANERMSLEIHNQHDTLDNKEDDNVPQSATAGVGTTPTIGFISQLSN